MNTTKNPPFSIKPLKVQTNIKECEINKNILKNIYLDNKTIDLNNPFIKKIVLEQKEPPYKIIKQFVKETLLNNKYQ